MKIKVEIVKVDTHEKRVYEPEATYTNEEIEDGTVNFLWGEGNYGCDCNREMFFLRANNEEEPDTMICGNNRFTIPRIILEDGREIVIDGNKI